MTIDVFFLIFLVSYRSLMHGLQVNVTQEDGRCTVRSDRALQTTYLVRAQHLQGVLLSAKRPLSIARPARSDHMPYAFSLLARRRSVAGCGSGDLSLVLRAGRHMMCARCTGMCDVRCATDDARRTARDGRCASLVACRSSKGIIIIIIEA